MMSKNLNDMVILNIDGVDYRCTLECRINGGLLIGLAGNFQDI